MKLVDIYEKSIDRTINSAVTVSNREKETIDAEIQEYVFTNELIEKLYSFLSNVMLKKSKRTGIWINGYYGSGKSHFIKYIDFCLSQSNKNGAFDHYLKAVKETDADLSEVTPSNLVNLRSQIEKSKVETIMFNVEDETDDGSGERLSRIFINMLNRHRGYNSDDIPLAILLEKELDKKGLFEKFQQILNEEHNYIWKGSEQNIASFALETVLDVAKRLMPSLDTNSLTTKLTNPDTYKVGIASTLIPELKDYLKNKEPSFRLIFLVDEISQYIGKNKDILLNFQNIIERVSEDLNNQVWIAVTAQQTLDNVTHGVGSNDPQDEFGKILGRFPNEFRISLESSDPAYITQKRVLEKNAIGRAATETLYRKNKDAVEHQFKMNHDLYKGFNSEPDFVLSYPFVPYQFRLIADVFDSFQSLQFVIKEVKNNERSVLGITHFTAQENKQREVGYFIPFDAFFNRQFNTNLTHRGRKAISQASELTYVKNNAFARRVVNVLFMISNLAEANRQTFPSTIENMTLLLMSDIDQNKLQLQNEIKTALDKLKDENVIREEGGKFFFFSEDEMDVMMQVQNTTLIYEDRLDEFDKLIRPLLKVDSRIRFGQNDFRVAYNVDEKEFLRNGNVQVKVLMLESGKAEERSFGNPNTTLLLCINEWLLKDESLRKELDLYFKTEKYLRLNGDVSQGKRAQTIESFRNRNAAARQRLEEILKHRFPETRFVSGQQVIDPSAINGSKSTERYQNILQKHMEMVYRNHSLAADYATTAADLKHKRPTIKAQLLTTNDLSQAEIKVNDKITSMGGEMTVDDLIRDFAKEPFGWKDIQVIHILVMLHKKKVREFSYRGQPRFPMELFVDKALISTERTALTVKQGEAISSELIEQARLNFNEVFNVSLPLKTDAGEVFEEMGKKVRLVRNDAAESAKKYISYPFMAKYHALQTQLEELNEIRDPRRFFEALGTKKDELKISSDACKQLDVFIERALSEYKIIKQFFADNHENLAELPDGNGEKIKWMDAFFRSDDPSVDFRTARKTYDELKTALNEQMKYYRGNMEKVYTGVFESLEAEATKLKVDGGTTADRNFTIENLKKQKSISSLKLAISNADSFRSKEIAKIIKAAEPKKTHEPGKKAEEPTANYKPGRAGKFHVISNEGEMDEYLQSLREDMVKILKDKKKIILE
ncbi:MAG TPA: BREX system P-loop protein BrxC [Prolixibacteraceae bacterium]|nr:BREX system P-loop protein BrxC [Prolixibacteraceae bacterium]